LGTALVASAVMLIFSQILLIITAIIHLVVLKFIVVRTTISIATIEGAIVKDS
jgi:hypothetical protein